MNLSKGLAGQTMIYGLGTIVPRLLNYILLTPFYTRIFSHDTSQYGTLSVLYAYSAFLLVLLTFGMETTYFRFSVKKENEQTTFNHTFLSTAFFAILFLLCALIFKNSIANQIGYEHNSNFIVFFAFIIFFDVVTAVPFARLRNQNKALKFVIIKLVNIVTNIILNVFFFLICRNSSIDFFSSLYNENIGVGYAFISNMIASAVSFIIMISEYRNVKFVINWKIYKEMLIYSWPLIIIGLGGMVNEVADKILLKYYTKAPFVPLEQIAEYSANYKIAMLMSIFIQMFKYAAEPYFFKKSISVDAKESYRRVMNYFTIFCLLIFLFVTLYIDIFRFFIDKVYYPGLKLVPIILLANMFLGMYYNLSIWYKIKNLTHYGAIITLAGVFVTLVLNIWLIPVIGYMGSAWATLACYFTMMFISYFWGNRVYKVKYNIKKISFYIIFAVILFLVRYFLKIDSILLSLVVSTLIGSIFLGVIYFVEKEEIRRFYASKNY
jgi:O-antigen/teichoic acid export membrane protein